MATGNSEKPPFPQRADQPKQAGQGTSVPKSIKVAEPYSGAPAGGGSKGKKG